MATTHASLAGRATPAQHGTRETTESTCTCTHDGTRAVGVAERDDGVLGGGVAASSGRAGAQAVEDRAAWALLLLLLPTEYY
jgi:hypothetical protein